MGTFLPKNRIKRRSGTRERCQFDHISNAVSRWSDPSDRLCLVLDHLAEAPPPSASVKEVRNLEDSNLYQCKRKFEDGHVFVAIKVLSSSSVAPLFTDTLQALESRHPFAPTPVLPSCNEEALYVSKDKVLRMIHSFPKGTSCGRDGLRAQHLMDMPGGAASVIADSLLCSITKVVLICF